MLILESMGCRLLKSAVFVLAFLLQFIKLEGSLVLTSSPPTATDGQAITLICSSSWGEVNRYWFRDDNVIFRTTQSLSTFSKAAISNPYIYSKYLSGRVSVSCNVLQHNVTLMINATIDRGSVWWCKDTVKSETSNHITLLTARLGRYADLSRVPNREAKDNDLGGRTVVYIAAGSACAVVVLVGVVVVLFIRRRRRTSGAMRDNMLYTVSSECLSADAPTQYREPVAQDVHVQVMKPKTK
ncbi:uncharacterized protein LOC124147988 [Haliotis rufescens]|uniref:uncharacterized protein LOC124147988 n=1 Tax=Haliotis rufescens TaxID=6454 RepID=UPI00201EDCF9|nr:uncharacterized protein LOC124147988 [Haliotis rufescens]